MLEVSSIHVHYGSAHVLHGASLRVQAGQIVCLLGRNGVGKSTTLKAVMGLVRPSGGSVVFRGRRIDGKRPHAIAALGIGWVPEDRRVFGSLSVEENLRVAAQATARSGIHRVPETLRIFPDLVARSGQLAGSLSGGQQQMLAIARALVMEPEFLLLDEPTEGLAPGLVQVIRDSILGSRARGMAILLVEQNLDLALAVGEYFFIMSRGAVVHEGTREDLLGRPEVIVEHLGVGRVRELSRWARVTGRDPIESP